MEYNLAKELKEAGFKNVRLCEREDEHMMKDCGECDMARYPTLEELIEACGDDFCFTLEINLFDKKWYAYDWDHQGHNYFYKGEGSTPSEAVARLWLAINKK